MQNQLIEFNTAKLAKEKGFNIHCRNTYGAEGQLWTNEDFPYNSATDSLFTPTQSLLQRWLREVHQIEVYVTPVIENKYITHGKYNNKDAYYQWMIWGKSFGLGDTYEYALEQGLYSALSLINS